MIGQCKNCKWWRNDVDPEMPRHGICEKVRAENDDMFWVFSYSDAYQLVTDMDFGCTEFEGRKP